MADLPIIFSAPMVRALLEGRKTQTRRVLKVDWNNGANPAFTGWHSGRIGPRQWQLVGGMGVGATVKTAYAVGDRLYVREAFWPCDECGYRNRCADGVNYSGFPDRGCCSSCDALLPRAKTSPIHMPRWASRLTLTVTDVRVQRLQEISRGNAMGEGCPFANMADGPSPVEWFHDLWNSLHGPEAWTANPWVAAYSFTVQRGNIDQIGGAA